MLKYIALLKRKEGMSLEAFRAYILNKHVPIASQIPSMREYRISVVEEDSPDLLYDAVAEHWFDDAAAAVAGGASPEGQAASKDIAEHCSVHAYLTTRETRII
jgi:uncharacterized protein (TIGR02118 family)